MTPSTEFACVTETQAREVIIFRSESDDVIGARLRIRYLWMLPIPMRIHVERHWQTYSRTIDSSTTRKESGERRAEYRLEEYEARSIS